MKTVGIASLLLFLIACDGYTQDSLDRMRNTEAHIGVGFHQLIHVGGRFRVDPFIMLEVDVGGYPFEEDPLNFPFSSYNPPYSFSFGVTAIPRPTQRHPGFIFTVLYTLWANQVDEDRLGGPKGNWSGFKHFISGNIGWVTQHSSGISFLARVGPGWAFDDYDFRGHDGRVHHATYVEFIPNIELAVGYAF